MRPTSLLALFTLCLASLASAQQPPAVSCLGRIEPAGGVVRLSGPTGVGAVIMELRAARGDWVEQGQTLAVLDGYPAALAEVNRLQAELELAEVRLARERKLIQSQATSASKIEELSLAVKAANAGLEAANARLNLSLVKAPKRAQVLDIHAQPGERIGVEGIFEIGQTDSMHVVAEVYETDIARVRVGQQATVRSPALVQPATGKVASVGLKVGRIDVLGVDPIAQADARVIEVTILLDDAGPVRSLTNLQVEVDIRS